MFLEIKYSRNCSFLKMIIYKHLMYLNILLFFCVLFCFTMHLNASFTRYCTGILITALLSLYSSEVWFYWRRKESLIIGYTDRCHKIILANMSKCTSNPNLIKVWSGYIWRVWFSSNWWENFSHLQLDCLNMMPNNKELDFISQWMYFYFN